MPVRPGCEPFEADGHGPLARTGVLVLHGFTGSPWSVRPWGEHLAAAGCAVRGPRLPGHGTTWRDLARTRWPDWYATAERGLDALLERCDRVVVAGLSMGGTLALRLAGCRPDDVAGVVTVNPALATERRDAPLLPLLRHVVPVFPGITNDIAKPGQDERGYRVLPLQAAHSLTLLWAEVATVLPEVSAPVLTFRSRTDHVVEPVSGAAAARGAARPGRPPAAARGRPRALVPRRDAGPRRAGDLRRDAGPGAGGVRVAGGRGDVDVTTTPEPPPGEEPDRSGWPSAGRRSNGLPGHDVVELLHVDPAVSERLLAELGRAGVLATAERRPDGRLDRLAVDGRHRDTALGLVRDVLDDVAGGGPRPAVEDPLAPDRDPFADTRAGTAADPSTDVDAAFRDLVARFDQGGPVRRPVGSVVDDPTDEPDGRPGGSPPVPERERPARGPRSRRRDRVDEPPADDEDRERTAARRAADDEEHYEPPPAPPVGRPSRYGQAALALLGLGLVLMIGPGLLGVSGDASVFAAGVVSCAVAAALAVAHLVRPRPTDGGDDGAVV